MATFSIAAVHPTKGARTFQIDARSRVEAEGEVRKLGWEPQSVGAAAGARVVPAEGAGVANLLHHPGLFTVLGALCLFIGPFLPAAYVMDERLKLGVFGDSWVWGCIIGGIIALACPMIGAFRHLYRLGGLLMVMVVIRSVMVYSKLDEAGRALSPMREAIAEVFVMPPITFGLDFGWLVLLAGPVLLLVSAWKASHSGYE